MIRSALHWPARYPIRALFVAALLAIAAAISTARLRADSSLQSFFSPDDPAAHAMNRVLEHFSAAEKLYLLVTTRQAQPDPDRLLAFAERFQKRVAGDTAATSLMTQVEFRADPRSRDFVANVIVPRGIFYLTDEQFQAAQHRLTREQMAEQLRQDESMLANPGPAAGALAKVLMQDPLRLRDFLTARLAELRPFNTYQNSDAFLSPDGRSLLIQIAGAKSPGDLAFCHQMTGSATTLAQAVNDDHLLLEFSGAYAIAAHSERAIRADSIASVIGSIISLALLFAISFRRSLALFVVTFSPIALGVLYGFGVYALFNPRFTPLTGVIGAMLAGVGIDYSIFYIVHYLERRAAGDSPTNAACTTITTIGGALLAAGATSVIGFMAVGFASIPLLRDFAVAGSLSLIGALLCTVFVLPALLVALDRPGNLLNTSGKTIIRPALGRCIAWASGRRATSILAVLLLIALGTLFIKGLHLQLESDARVMQPQPNPPLDAEADIARRMGGGQDSLIVHLQADSPEALLQLAHRVKGKLDSSQAHTAGVLSTLGLATFLPDPGLVPARMARVGPAFADKVIADFDAAVAGSNFEAKAFAPYEIFLRTLLTPPSAPGVADLIADPQVAQELLPHEAISGAPATEALTLVFLKANDDSLAARALAVSTLRKLLADEPAATLTGIPVLSLDTQATIRHDLPRFILIAGLTIAVFLVVYFRSITDSVLALLPTLCSLTFLIAVARLVGAKMNLANIVSIPLLIGIDVDYGIFLVSLARKSSTPAELRSRVSASSQAIVLCAAATLLGFGSLVFTSVPAIQSLGWAVAIGVAACATTALFLLMPLLLWLRGRSKRSDGSSTSVKLIGLGAPLLLFVGTGCSAPSGRLSFPTSPLRQTPEVDWYDVHHNGHAQFGVARDASGRTDRLLYDDTGDGHIDREYRLADYSASSVPHLILLLDSLPFQTVQDRYQAGDFRWFDPPQKMIAPFPSLTELCYTQILHAPPLPGVIDTYFDPRDEQRKDILWARVRGYTQPWERRLNYFADYMQQGLSFLDPEQWYAAELEQARLAMDRSPDHVTIVYIASAASMVCKFGKPGAEKVLDGARQLCLQLLYERHGAIRISMMADHGHNYTPSKNVLLDPILQAAGFHPADKIQNDRDCVVEINALVTCAGVHTRHPAEVADAICHHDEVELAIYLEGPRVIIQTAAGKSAVECRDGRLRYVPLDADVLGYGQLMAQLKASGKMDADGFATDEVWFHETLNHHWPNAPRRVWHALHGLVINPPTVIIAMKDGYYAGDPSFEKYITMASTHGGLNQVNSATFVMTMHGQLNGAVRHEDVIDALEPGFMPRVQR